MRVLLTGGAGFIGSHAAVAFMEAGYELVIVDDLSNSSLDTIERIQHITGRDVSFYQANAADRSALEPVFKEQAIDAVVHFAGFKAVGESVAEPLKYYRNNINTTLSLLEVMEQYGVEIFVFSSSATVYGDPETVPIKETAPAGRCSNPYGRTKYFIEQILIDAAQANSALAVVLLRYFNPIGAHQSGLIGEQPRGIPNNLMPYITQTAAGWRERLHIFGNDYPTRDGTGVRDYIHVADLAQGHAAALRYALTHGGTEIFNLGTGTGYSVLEVVNTFEQVTGRKIPYLFAPRRAGDIAECYASVQKAASVLGWRAEKNLADMCRDAWRWQEQLKVES